MGLLVVFECQVSINSGLMSRSDEKSNTGGIFKLLYVLLR